MAAPTDLFSPFCPWRPMDHDTDQPRMGAKRRARGNASLWVTSRWGLTTTLLVDLPHPPPQARLRPRMRKFSATTRRPLPQSPNAKVAVPRLISRRKAGIVRHSVFDARPFPAQASSIPSRGATAARTEPPCAPRIPKGSVGRAVNWEAGPLPLGLVSSACMDGFSFS